MGEAARKTAVQNLSPAQPSSDGQPMPKVREALVIEKLQGSEGWALLQLTLVGNLVTAEKRIGHAYYRDLAEQQAAKLLRTMGRK